MLALAGALGTLARYALGGLVQAHAGTFPWGTLAVNVLGAFVLGFLARLLFGSTMVTPEIRATIMIGFFGAFTTMSTFSYETIALVNGGEMARAVGYVLGSVGGSLAAMISGLWLGARLL
jgi:fluoride exporter